jgi:hypothetical protein
MEPSHANDGFFINAGQATRKNKFSPMLILIFTSLRKANRFALFSCLSFANGIAVIASQARMPAKILMYSEPETVLFRSTPEIESENKIKIRAKKIELAIIESRLVEYTLESPFSD